MENYLELLKNKQIKKVLYILGTFIIIVIIASVILMNVLPKSASEQADHLPDESDLNEPGVYFENRYLLDYTVGKIHDTEVLNNIEEFIMEEISSAPSRNVPIKGERENLIKGVIEEEGFKKLNNQPKYTYFFYFNTSDSRKYTIYVRTDENYGREYVVTVIIRNDQNASSDRIYINTNNEAAYKQAIVDWANTLGTKSPKTIVKSLESDEEQLDSTSIKHKRY